MEAPTGFIRKYIFSVDHKVIGIQYFLLALTAVLVGIVLSVLMRLHLVWPNMHLPFVPGGLMTQEQYLSLVTMHGTIMFFRAHHRAARLLRQLLLAHSNRRSGYGVSAAQHVVLLGHVPCVHRDSRRVRRSRRRTNQRLDGLHASQRTRRSDRPR
jgi:hypothetical protein